MKNFSKSILYSTTVLAVGVVGAFTIYNNVSPSNEGASLANISPASGQSDLGINFSAALDNADYVFEGTTSNAAEMMESSAGALNDMVSAAGDKVSDAVEATTEGASNIANAADDKISNVVDDATETSDTVSDAADDNVSGIADKAEESTTEITDNVDSASDVVPEVDAVNDVADTAKEIIKY